MAQVIVSEEDLAQLTKELTHAARRLGRQVEELSNIIRKLYDTNAIVGPGTKKYLSAVSREIGSLAPEMSDSLSMLYTKTQSYLEDMREIDSYLE